MTADFAASIGDTLDFGSNTPGGFTFQGHSTNANTLSRIAQGNWDYVVLQEQSQRPSFPDNQVNVEVFPYARVLDSLIRAANPCTETVFYMTWGRKNGDAGNCQFWPPVCTYEGMDSLLRLRYEQMAQQNDALVSPVGVVWRHIRQNFPDIELYQADESHPSVAGSYAAACTFYTILFRKDPSLGTYDAGLSPADAATIRDVVKNLVFDNLAQWQVGNFDPMASFSISQPGVYDVNFSNTSLHADSYSWYFGDGNSSSLANPSHIYADTGSYQVLLVAQACSRSDSMILNLQIVDPTGISQQTRPSCLLYPNPVGNTLNLESTLFEQAGTYIQILNAQGQVLLQEQAKFGLKQQISTAVLPKGLYHVQVIQGQVVVYTQTITK